MQPQKNQNQHQKQKKSQAVQKDMPQKDASQNEQSQSEPLKQQQQQIKQKQQNDNKQGQEASLSKKQLKKIQKKQKWEQIKREKRKQQREKQKQKRKLKKQQIKQMGLQQPQKIENHEQKQPAKKRKQQYKQKMMDGQKVVIDLQFYDLMTEKQKTSLGKQLAYCHSVNRKAQKCFNFILTSATQNCMKFLNQKYNIDNFGITLLQPNILDCFNRQKLVYLTGDAPQELDHFNQQQIYIIGGIVDHNRLKNITINFANQKQIKARRLPMEGVKLRASVHLAVNHVWEWMLRFYNGATWKQAIQAVIPQRKLELPENQKND